MKKEIIGFITGMLFMAGGDMIINYHMNSYTKEIIKKRVIPDKDKVQENYIIPSKLEIKCEDIDKYGKINLPETYLNYNGKSYLFKFDSTNQKPVCIPYEIQTKIIEK